VACNTATTAAIHLMRAENPALPIVGLEPGLKPAVATSRTGHIAVMATRGTLASAKYAALRTSFAGSAEVRPVPCDGLVKAIEGFDAAGIAALCERYMNEAGPFGEGATEVDTVVLGCTHYPLVKDELRKHAPATLRFIDTGVPVAQQTRRLLAAAGQLAGDAHGKGTLRLESSGQVAVLEAAAARWLGLSAAAASA
jgi:glutamate racemase